ncbi:MAG: dihydroxy-acid dehydratase [Candidatus Lernaella stagnicola]|nr:dihydroxy-acid dehydratase [Candidatus Lernaella stagnicola]
MSDNNSRGIFRNLASYGDTGFSRYMRRAFLASMGCDAEDIDRPIIGIVDTSSDYVTCHRQMPELVAAVKRGVLEAGGLPFAFPTISLHEIFVSPTTMLFRNLMAMDTEEMIRAQPMDGVVLLGGCDKTVPAQLMAAASADVPAISVITGPMFTGRWRGERLGACTDCRRYWAKYRAGEITDAEIAEIEKNLCPTGGTCMVMGTASTMACVTEALGMMLPGGACAPLPTGERLRLATASGRQIVQMVECDLNPRDILKRRAFKNALVVLVALGGSTNAIIHLTAVARRAGVTLTLDDLQHAAERVPLLADCKPAGVGYLEDLYYAGGVPVLMKELEPLLNLETVGCTGKLLGELLSDVDKPGDWQTTIRTLDEPLGPVGSLTALAGSLAPDGAIIKRAAATPELLHHRGPAVVFESPEDVAARIDDPALAITPQHVLVMRNAGPIASGMPEAGALPIPRYLAEKGVKDMVRVSDARMSGTAYGTIVLHCAPEAAAGGPLALVETGDEIELDIDKREINLLISADEQARRRAAWQPPALPARGYRRLHMQHVLQANEGADLDFL